MTIKTFLMIMASKQTAIEVCLRDGKRQRRRRASVRESANLNGPHVLSVMTEADMPMHLWAVNVLGRFRSQTRCCICFGQISSNAWLLTTCAIEILTWFLWTSSILFIPWVADVNDILDAIRRDFCRTSTVWHNTTKNKPRNQVRATPTTWIYWIILHEPEWRQRHSLVHYSWTLIDPVRHLCQPLISFSLT